MWHSLFPEESKYFRRILLLFLVPFFFITCLFSKIINAVTVRSSSSALKKVFASNTVLSFEKLGLEYRGMPELLQEIACSHRTDSLAEAAWRYVVENSFHHPSVTENNWLHHPEVFFNSIGFGLCGDQAAVLAALWKAMRFQVRIWSLNKEHVVAEVNDGRGWKVFDPDLKCFFTRADNTIASYEDLVSDVPLHFHSYHPRTTILTLLEDGSINHRFRQAYADDIRRFYRAGTNADITQQQLCYPSYISGHIVMPVESALNFLQSDAFHIDDGLPVKNIIKIILFPGAKGVLYLPLMPLGCEGNFRFIKTGQDIQIAGTYAFDYSSIQIDSFLVSGVGDTSAIYFLANGIRAVAHTSSFQRLDYSAVKPFIKPAGEGSRMEAFLNITEINDTLFSKLRSFTAYLSALNPSLNTPEDFECIYYDFNKMVYNRHIVNDDSHLTFFKGFLDDNSGYHPNRSPLDNWNLVTMLCYAISAESL